MQEYLQVLEMGVSGWNAARHARTHRLNNIRKERNARAEQPPRILLRWSSCQFESSPQTPDTSTTPTNQGIVSLFGKTRANQENIRGHTGVHHTCISGSGAPARCGRKVAIDPSRRPRLIRPCTTWNGDEINYVAFEWGRKACKRKGERK